MRLSVIIPIYNTRKYLEECIESVLKCQFDDLLEIILVDDESPDGAGIICDEYEKKYNNIKVIHKKNEGLGKARNSGIKIAEGEYITFLDSDDLVKRYYFRDLINKISQENADICFAGGIISFKKNKEKISKFCIETKPYTTREDIIKLAPRIIGPSFKKDDELPGSACLGLYKRKFLLDNNIDFVSEREIISEDIWFNLECIAKAKKIIYTSDIGYIYRYNPASLSRNYYPKRFRKIVLFEKKLLEKCQKLELVDYYERVEMNFWRNFEKCINQEVRFNIRKSKFNIKKMCENEITCSFLEDLTKSKLINGFHHILLILLLKKKYRSTIYLLNIYNIIYKLIGGRR
ncbi:glycosyltransferase family 2 protein [uncultured Dubosiella sp.]|uniref:glycosyltransferase family 2 protein n=2 Tax=uncultured Dubosiella sp. TaxID=1937011 RepID=UPI002711E08A|nr:glycosyltransferase family 2 protein [uncultured Dubosiella sp.]